MSPLNRFRLEPLFLPDNALEGNHEPEGNGSETRDRNTTGSSNDDNMFPDPAEITPSQPSTRSSTTFAVPFSPQTQCVIKTYGQGVSRKLELPDGSLDEFVKVSVTILQHEYTLLTC